MSVRFAEGVKLFYEDIFQTGKMFQDAVCRSIEVFSRIDQIARNRPLGLERLGAALNQQDFEAFLLISEYNTVDRKAELEEIFERKVIFRQIVCDRRIQ